MNLNLPFYQFSQLQDTEKQKFIDKLVEASGFRFQWAGYDDFESLKFLDSKLKVEFRYIFCGSFLMGLSDEEEKNARILCDPPSITINELRPVHQVNIDSFFVSSSPICVRLANKILPEQFYDQEESHPAFLSKDEADKLLNLIDATLPSEEQWEYFCRAGTTSLFVFGNRLPEHQELDRWLDWDLDQNNKNICKNKFGLYGLFFTEWCNDYYHESYEEYAKVDKNSYVIRGGGAYFWPWQDDEWVFCMSSMRSPSSDLEEDRRAAARAVVLIN